MKKGFMHIIEIVLVTLLLFFIFSQFVSIPKTATDWPETKLFLMARDVLEVLDERDVDWLNETEVKGNITELQDKGMIPGNIIYSLRAENVIKPDMRVACAGCTEEDYGNLTSVLEGFEWNGKEINFTVQREENFGSSFYPYYDVVVIMDGSLPQDTDSMENFLGMDKGIVGIFEPSFTPSQEKYFGVMEGGTTAGTGEVRFSPEARRAGSQIYGIYKVFTNMGADGEEFPLEYGFSNTERDFLESGEKTIWDEGRSEVVLIQEGSGVAACISRYYVSDGKGRIAWVSGGNFSRTDYSSLVKSLVCWAAGDEVNVIESKISEPVSASIYRSMNQDAFQGARITLTVGYPF